MKVDFTNLGVDPPDKSSTSRAEKAGNTGNDGARSATNNSTPTSSAAAGRDQTSFSFDQARVQSLQAQALAQPEIREAKVKTLQQSIDKGEYSVPASHVADALISEFSGAQG